jgi:tape measure domain-containing protein
MSAAGAVNIRLGAITTDFVNAMKGAAGSVRGAVSEMNTDLAGFYRAQERQQGVFAKGFGKLATDLKSVGKNLTAGLTVPILGIGAAMFASYGDIDAMERGLTSLSGSTKVAKAEFSTFREIAKLPGLGLEEAEAAGLRMRSLGYDTSKAKNQLQQFGNAIALGGGGATQFDSILNQVTQMSSKSKVLAEDLKPIVNASPVIAKAIKDMFGTVDSEQISKKLQAAGKGPQDFLDLLVSKLETLERVSGGPKNAIENFGDSLKVSSYEIGKAADESLGLTDKLNGLGDAISDGAKQLGEMPGPAKATIFGITGIAAAIGPATLGIGGFISLVPTMKKGLDVIKAGFAFMIGPIGLWVAAIAAVGTALYSIYDFNKAIDQSVDKTRLLAAVQKDVALATDTERDRLGALLEIARDETKSKEARLSAIRDINAASPKYLGDLDLDTIGTNKATQAIGKYIQMLSLKAQVQSQAAKIAEAQSKLSQIEKSSPDDYSSVTDNIGGFFKSVAGGGGLNDVLDQKRAERQRAAYMQQRREVRFLNEEQEKALKELTKMGESTDAKNPIGAFADKTATNLEKAKVRLKELESRIAAITFDGVKVPAGDIAEATRLKKQIAAADDLVNKPKAKKDPDTFGERTRKDLKAVNDLITEFKSKNPNLEVPFFLKLQKGYYQDQLKLDDKIKLPKPDGIGTEADGYWKKISNGWVVSGITSLKLAAKRLPGAIEEIQESISNSPLASSTELDLFSGIISIDNIKAGISQLTQITKSGAEGFKKNLTEILQIDPEARGQTLQNWIDLADGIKSTLESAGESAAVGIGEVVGGLVSGSSGLNALPQMILSVVGDAAIQLGKLAIGIGVSVEAIKTAFKSLGGAGAVAAGIALIALGSVAKSGAASIGKKMGGAKAFAKGGVVKGPTLGLVGEYASARTGNPEVISPLNSLKSMLSPLISSTINQRFNENLRSGSYSGNLKQGGFAQSIQIEVLGRLAGQDIYFSGQRFQKSKNNFG